MLLFILLPIILIIIIFLIIGCSKGETKEAFKKLCCCFYQKEKKKTPILRTLTENSPIEPQLRNIEVQPIAPEEEVPSLHVLRDSTIPMKIPNREEKHTMNVETPNLVSSKMTAPHNNSSRFVLSKKESMEEMEVQVKGNYHD